MRHALGLLAGVALLGAGCGGSAPPPGAVPIAEPEPTRPSDEPSAAEKSGEGERKEDLLSAEARRQVAQALARVADVRGLSIKGEIASRVLDREALLDRVREHVATEVPAEVIEGQGEMLVALGLVPAGFDYPGAIFRLLESQLAGFYEPREKAMYLAGDLGGEAAKATLAHELVHALQDQHWDLAPRLAYKPGGGDEQSAVHALAEGDATSAMMDVLLRDAGRSALDLPEAAFALEAEMSVMAGAELGEIPRVLRASLVAPYVDGLKFVHDLRRRGGWAAVDAAWLSPPKSTEQLLHHDKYEAKEPPEPMPAPPPPGEGWVAMHDDVLGEQGLRIVLEEWAPKRVARVAAAGWGGDRAILFRQVAEGGPTFAMLWHLRFDGGAKRDAEAREAFEVLASVTGQRPRGDRLCAERPGIGTRAVLRSGRDVVVAAGPYRHADGHLDPQAGCAETLRWASKALAKTLR